MKILDKIIEWIAEQVMNGLDLVNSSIFGALGMDMTAFNQYFPAVETMYKVFVWIGVSLVLLNLIWGLFKGFGYGLGIQAEEPLKILAKSVIALFLVINADKITSLVLNMAGTPLEWILNEDLPSLDFANFNSVLLTVVGTFLSSSVGLIVLVLLLILAFNYLKLLLKIGEDYIVLAILIYTAPIALATSGLQSTANIAKSWGRMLGGQIILIIMNAWCLRLFVSMVGNFISNPLQI